MRALHSFEETLYGPRSTLPAKAKVMLCIRHNTVRWDETIKPIKYDFIIQKTGLIKRRVIEAVHQLEKDGMILVLRSKQNNIHQENLIGINPDFFGEILEKEHKPKFSVIEGGKVVKLQKVDVLKTAHQNSPDYVNPHIDDVLKTAHQNERNFSELLEEIRRNNKSKEHKNLKEPENPGELNAQLKETGSKSPSRELQREWLRETDGAYDFSAWFQKRMAR